MSNLIKKADAIAAPDIPKERIEIPEWGGYAIVRGLNGTERDAFEAETVSHDAEGKAAFNRQNIRARLVARCLVDEEGARIFTDEDAAALGKKSALVLDRIFAVAQRLSGLTKKDVDELEKNSPAGRSGASTSGSH